MRSEITHQLKEKRNFVFRLEHAKLYSPVNRGDVIVPKANHTAFVYAVQSSKHCISKCSWFFKMVADSKS